jgi:type I restriction enzyme S subunit
MINKNSLAKIYPKVMLGQVVEFLDNIRQPVKENLRIPGPYPYYGANGQMGTINNYIFDEELILLAEDGGHFGNPNKPIAFKVHGKCWVNNHAHVLRPKRGIDIDFLKWHLQHYDVSSFITGSTRPKLNKVRALNILLILPPLSTQKGIAKILDLADGLRRKRRQAVEMLDELLRATFLDMFGDPATNPMKFNVKLLKNVLKNNPQNGIYVPKELYVEKEGVEMVHMADAFYGIVNRGKLRRVNISKKDIVKYMVKSDDVLIARRSLNYAGAAKPCRIPYSNEPLVFESSLIRLSLNKEMILPIYLYYYFSNERARNTYILKYITSSTISGINQNGLKSIKIIIPPIELQKRFSNIVEQTEALKERMQSSLVKMDNLFHSLMQRAFKGELKLNED